MSVDIQKLKALAEAAQQWSGEIGESRWYEAECFKRPYFSKPDAEFIAAANPAAVLELIAELEAERQRRWDGNESSAREHAEEVQALKAENDALRATCDLKALLPDTGDALEDLELHGRHSDQGYRKLKEWYRKVALAYRVIDGPMFDAEHGELVSQNTWLRSVVEHYAQQHAPLEPIPDREGWSTRLPGYDLPALLRDAERYRWLRLGMGKVIVMRPDDSVTCDCERNEVLLENEVDDAADEAIKDAMSKGPVMTDLMLRNESDRTRLMGYLQGLDLTKPRKLTIVEVRSKRSDAQNKLLWMWNGLIQAHLRDSFGQIASSEEWHEILVSRLWPAEVHPVQLPDGTRYRVGRAKTRSFTIAQMTTYLELLDAYCAEHLQLLLPHPDDLMYAIYGERRAA